MRRVVLYAPLMVRRWGQVRLLDGRPLAPCAALGSAFIPLFDSLEELRRHYPDAEVVELEIEERVCEEGRRRGPQA